MAIWETDLKFELVFNLSTQHIYFHKIYKEIKLKFLDIQVIIMSCMQQKTFSPRELHNTRWTQSIKLSTV